MTAIERIQMARDAKAQAEKAELNSAYNTSLEYLNKHKEEILNEVIDICVKWFTSHKGMLTWLSTDNILTEQYHVCCGSKIYYRIETIEALKKCYKNASESARTGMYYALSEWVVSNRAYLAQQGFTASANASVGYIDIEFRQ